MVRKIKKLLNFFPENLIFLFAFLTRFINLGYPKNHMFDEVYHAFTAQQMFRGNPAAWEWWNQSPPGFAYEWTHPPLAKEFMVLGMYIFGDNSFAWRFFSAFFGFGTIVLIYLITLHLFKKREIAIIASLVASLDGLMLVMSRIAMNDSYFLFFSLLAIYMFLKDKKILMGIFLGLSLASKWTAIFAIFPLLALFILKEKKIYERLKFLFFLLVIPAGIYLGSYIPFFLGHHVPPQTNYSNLQTFVELQKQMWWYHTNLHATHPYQSVPIQWIFNTRPVWLFVDYKSNLVSNIYTLDNPLIPILGILSIVLLIYKLVNKLNYSQFLIVLFYLAFFILWFHSPRIMFNYHYLPSTAFLTIAIGGILYEIKKIYGNPLFGAIVISLVILFIYFYPIWVGIPITQSSLASHFWLSTWR